jgi:hypothetical protein
VRHFLTPYTNKNKLNSELVTNKNLIGEPLRNAKQNRKLAILVNTATKDGIAGKTPILFNTVLNAAMVAIVEAVIKSRIP